MPNPERSFELGIVPLLAPRFSACRPGEGSSVTFSFSCSIPAAFPEICTRTYLIDISFAESICTYCSGQDLRGRVMELQERTTIVYLRPVMPQNYAHCFSSFLAKSTERSSDRGILQADQLVEYPNMGNGLHALAIMLGSLVIFGGQYTIFAASNIDSGLS